MQSFLQSLCLAFDKGTEVPIFICVNCWREVHRRIFLDTPRYKQLLRCADARDTRFLLLWRLADTFSLSFFGKDCAFSFQHATSLLPDAAPTQCACMHGRCRPSAGCQSLYAPLLATACSKLKELGPNFGHETLLLHPPCMTCSPPLFLRDVCGAPCNLVLIFFYPWMGQVFPRRPLMVLPVLWTSHRQWRMHSLSFFGVLPRVCHTARLGL